MRLRLELQAHVAVEVAVFGPGGGDLDVQEEVHGAIEDFGQILAALLADPFQGLAALAEHDGPLAFALPVDGLLDARGAVADRASPG